VDLSTTDGAATLYRRLQGAARFVCGESGRGLADQRAWNDCYRQAVGAAVDTVDSPRLTALYREHSGAAAVTAMLTRCCAAPLRAGAARRGRRAPFFLRPRPRPHFASGPGSDHNGSSSRQPWRRACGAAA
jgi:hypothetical protein